MSETTDTTTLLTCDTCGSLGVGDDDIDCCEGPMRQVPRGEDAVEGPTLGELLRTVFDMSDTELDVCLCVMAGGPKTVKELADEIDYDRSVVARHLNHLADLGVVEKHRRLLEDGGHVYVYAPNEPEVVRERLTRHFLSWVGAATERFETLRREKVASIVAAEAREPQWQIYQRE